MGERGAPVIALVIAGALASVAVAQSSASVGTPQDGTLVGGIELPLRGEGYHWETNRGNPTARFGTPALIAGLVRAAAEVARAFRGSDLAIHDLSLEGGGPIRGHGSHRSGRDADVAYYAIAPGGARIDPTTSTWFAGRRGLARGVPPETAPRIDAERTWRFLSTLLTDPSLRVQYVFAAPPLQRLILEAGSSDRALAARARTILRTPHGRRVDPHADHFHVRIFCPEADRARGCID